MAVDIGGGVGGRPRKYSARYWHSLPFRKHVSHGSVPLHLALRDLQWSHARLTFKPRRLFEGRECGTMVSVTSAAVMSAGNAGDWDGAR